MGEGPDGRPEGDLGLAWVLTWLFSSGPGEGPGQGGRGWDLSQGGRPHRNEISRPCHFFLVNLVISCSRGSVRSECSSPDHSPTPGN